MDKWYRQVVYWKEERQSAGMLRYWWLGVKIKSLLMYHLLEVCVALTHTFHRPADNEEGR